MKILYFSRNYTPHDHRILSSLATTSHRVYYLSLEKGEFVFEDRPLPDEIELVEWKSPHRSTSLMNAPGRIIELSSIAKKIKPDLIQAGPLQRSALLAALAGLRPLVSMSWGYDLLLDAKRNVIWHQATRFVLSRSDLLIGDCETIRQLAISYGMPDRRIVTFPWGIDLDHFSPQESTNLQNDLADAGESFSLLSTRSWEPIYGVETIIDAFILVAQTQPFLQLIMLGNGSLAATIKYRLSEAGLFSSQQNSRVIFPGQVGFYDLPTYYRRANLYLSASHSDGTSISMLEAMACSLPVMVSDIPGNREWVIPGENGWLFPVGDSSSLAEALQMIIANRENLVEMGKTARKIAEARADWQVNFPKMLQAYELVASKN